MTNDGPKSVHAMIEARLRVPAIKIAQKTYLRNIDVATGGKDVETLVDDFTTRHSGVAVTSLDDMVRVVRAVHALVKNGAPLDEIKEAAIKILDVYVFT